MFNLLKVNTKSHLKRNNSLRSSAPYHQAAHIGMMFTVEDRQKHDHVKELVRKLEHDGKKISVICFLPKDKQNYEFMFDFFTDKEISFWGQITSQAALEFTETPFDYLFYLDTEPNPLILNLLARSKAKCRMGKYWDNGEQYFEFMIGSTGGITGLIDDLYKYTSILK